MLLPCGYSLATVPLAAIPLTAISPALLLAQFFILLYYKTGANEKR